MLDAADFRSVTSSDGANADAFVLRAAGLWDTFRHLNRAFGLIVKGNHRVGFATAAVVIEGRDGLNLGLLMPSLKRLSAPPIAAEPDLRRFDERYKRLVWDIATRLERVEFDRRMVFRIGKNQVHLAVSRAGFTFIGGCKTIAEFLAALRTAADRKVAVAYTLADHAKPEIPPQHQLYSFFDAFNFGDGKLQFATDGWPEAIPAGTGMTTIRALAAAVQRLNDQKMETSLRFSVIDLASKPILSGTQDPNGVVLSLASPEGENG